MGHRSDPPKEYSVGEISRLAGVTIRTLHHYDEIGLLRPSGRSEAGYRLYGPADLERLRQILVYRQLGFTLHEIAGMLDQASTEISGQLLHQHALLVAQIERLQAIVKAIDTELEAHRMNVPLSPEDRLAVFGDFDPEEHEQETQQRWGATEAYRQSKRRAASYTKEDWERIKSQSTEIERQMVGALQAGASAQSEQAMALAEKHRLHIDRWFYVCSHAMHLGLTAMYVEDERFLAHYEAIAPGLARFVRDAAKANARRAGP